MIFQILTGILFLSIIGLIIYFRKQLKKKDNDTENQLLELERLATDQVNKLKESAETEISKAEDIISKYQKYIVSVDTKIRFSEKKLKELDALGSFEADDEIGFFFKAVQEIQKSLNDLKIDINEITKDEIPSYTESQKVLSPLDTFIEQGDTILVLDSLETTVDKVENDLFYFRDKEGKQWQAGVNDVKLIKKGK